MKLQTTLIVATLALGTSACASKPVASPSIAPSVSISPNHIAPNAAKAYRQALNRSLSDAQSLGLTELWSDSTETLVTVVVQDPKTGVCAQSDLIMKETQLIDVEAMMPSVLIAELDGLESNSGSDVGSVTLSANGDIKVTNFMDDTHYTTTYTIDSSGRIATATQFAEGELTATASFDYHVTDEGKRALAEVSN